MNLLRPRPAFSRKTCAKRKRDNVLHPIIGYDNDWHMFSLILLDVWDTL